MNGQPVYLRYAGEGCFEPANQRQAKASDAIYTIGEVYPLEPAYQRSHASHNHEFAFVNEAWLNLPESYSIAPFAASPEHLRKHALIMTGWCDTQTFACGSKAEAERWAANLRPLDEYSVVIVQGTTVTRAVAKSQSMRAMGKKDFQASKTAIMEYLEDMIRVGRGALTGQAA